MRLRDGLHHREAKTRTGVGCLGGKERLEDLLQRLLIHTATVVAY